MLVSKSQPSTLSFYLGYDSNVIQSWASMATDSDPVGSGLALEHARPSNPQIQVFAGGAASPVRPHSLDLRRAEAVAPERHNNAEEGHVRSRDVPGAAFAAKSRQKLEPAVLRDEAQCGETQRLLVHGRHQLCLTASCTMAPRLLPNQFFKPPPQLAAECGCG